MNELLLQSNKESYLSFQIGNELYACSVQKVLEVLQAQRITFVPQSPPHVLGVINFRGEIIPVADTRSLFGLPAREEGRPNVIIVFEIAHHSRHQLIAATADCVKDVCLIDTAQLKPYPSLKGDGEHEFILGIGKIGNQFVSVLNIDKTFQATAYSVQIEQATE